MKTILITGVSRGLGLALIEHILTNTNNTVLACSRTLSPELNILISKYYDRFIWRQIDLAQTNIVEAEILELIGGRFVDVYINNASILYKSLVLKFNCDEFQKMIAINMIAPVIISKTVIENFMRNKIKGVLLHYSSICAHKGFAGLSLIATTKGGIESFSKNIAFEYGAKGIRSNVVAIGILDIGMSSTVNSRQREEIINMANLKSTTDAESVIALTDYLISDKSKSVTGQVFHINSGIF